MDERRRKEGGINRDSYQFILPCFVTLLLFSKCLLFLTAFSGNAFVLMVHSIISLKWNTSFPFKDFALWSKLYKLYKITTINQKKYFHTKTKQPQWNNIFYLYYFHQTLSNCGWFNFRSDKSSHEIFIYKGHKNPAFKTISSWFWYNSVSKDFHHILLEINWKYRYCT